MGSKTPPLKNTAFTFRTPLFSQSDNQILDSPTLALGDFKVSVDGGTLNNLATTPSESPAGSGQVLISLSASEMNGDEIFVKAVDASGDEWHSQAWTIHTAAQTLDSVASSITSLNDLSVADVNAQVDAAISDASLATAAAIAALNDLSAAQVNAEVDAAISDASLATAAAIAALNDLSAAQVNAEVDSAISDASLATALALNNFLAFSAGEFNTIKTSTNRIPTSPAAVGSEMTLADGAITTAKVDAGFWTQLKSTVSAIFGSDTQSVLEGVPDANAPLADMIGWLYMLARNKKTQTNAVTTLYADDGTTVISTSAVADDGTTMTRGEYS